MLAGRSGSSLSGLLRVLRSPAVALTPRRSPAAALTPRSPALANRVHLDQVWPLRLLFVAHLTAGGRQLVGERAPAQPTCGGTRVPPSEPEATPCVRCRSAPSQVESQSDAQCCPSSTCRRVAGVCLFVCLFVCLLVCAACRRSRPLSGLVSGGSLVCWFVWRTAPFAHPLLRAGGGAWFRCSLRPNTATRECPRAPTSTHPFDHAPTPSRVCTMRCACRVLASCGRPRPSTALPTPASANGCLLLFERVDVGEVALELGHQVAEVRLHHVRQVHQLALVPAQPSRRPRRMSYLRPRQPGAEHAPTTRSAARADAATCGDREARGWRGAGAAVARTS